MISIVIPLYNEAENAALYPVKLFPVAESIIRQYRETCEFVLVDDGSRDTTLEVISTLQKTQQNIIVVPHIVNRGMGAAVKTGFAHSNGNLIITMDSDLTYRPEDIDKLLSAYTKTGADCISASPYHEKDLANEITSPFRLFISKSVNFLYKVLLRDDITCVSAIFRLYKKEALSGMTFESNNFEIDAEIISKFILSGKNVEEIGVKLYVREHGESKLNVKKETINNLRILYKIFKSRYLKREWG